MKFENVTHIDKPVVNLQVVNQKKNEYQCCYCNSTVIIKDYFGRCPNCKIEFGGPLFER